MRAADVGRAGACCRPFVHCDWRPRVAYALRSGLMTPPRTATRIANPTRAASHHVARFSLVIGGPLYELYRRARLLDPPIDLVMRRLAVVVAILWLPLLLFTVISGKATGGTSVPFLFDLGVQIQLLLALPMLIVAEPIVHRSLRLVVRQFADRGLIAGADLERFERLVDETIRLRNSVFAEAALLVLSTVIAYAFRRDHWSLRTGLWSLDVDAGGRPVLNVAGWWYTLVSLNVFRFVLLRWYYRLAIWYTFLWRTSRLSLHLNPLHPDRAGGLAFLGQSLVALTPVFVAQTLTIAGAIGGRVLHDRTLAFPTEVLGFPLMFAVIAGLPFAFFSPRLIRAGFHGPLDYGRLSSRYVDGFRARWMRGDSDRARELLGSADIQSLADLSSAYDVVDGVRALPVELRPVLVFVAATALPFLPLVLTVIPLKELLSRLAGVVL